MSNYPELRERVYIVTGASSGIGRACAVYLSKCGARCVLIARREDMLSETLSMLEGCGHDSIPYDLSGTDGIEALFKSVISKHGAVSGIVYCAGIAPERPLAMTKKINIEAAMTVNFYSYVELVRCLSKKGCYRENASCVAISSVSSMIGNKAKLAYCSSKAALDAGTRCMAKALAEKGIRLNTIQPGWVETELYARYKESWGDNAESAASLSKSLLGVSKPEEIAAMAAYLLSDNAKTITGTAVRIDSGYLA